MATDYITIRGARVHNLKNVDLKIPKNKLVTVTGISGSGKSSLAFDTIYAEGQRRYVESLSAYARQFLGMMDKPEVDSIEGLSPAISIDQSASRRTKNPRSTVGTTTEIYDYLRLLYARIGIPHCPECGREVHRQTPTQITDQLLELPEGTHIMILAPLVKDRKGKHKDLVERLDGMGYIRFRFDGDIMLGEEFVEQDIDKNKRHTLEVVVDRVTVEDTDNPDTRVRIAESVEQALDLGERVLTIVFPQDDKKEDELFSEDFVCLHCGINLPDIEPRTFSFNSPHGACDKCSGLGYTQQIQPGRVFPNKRLSIAEGAVHPWSASRRTRIGRGKGWYKRILRDLAHVLDFSLDTPVRDLPESIVDIILYGKDSKKLQTTNYTLPTGFEGVVPNLLRRYRETSSDYTRKEIERYMAEKTCTACEGRRLSPVAQAVTVAKTSIDEIVEMSITDAHSFFATIYDKKDFTTAEKTIATPIVKEVQERLSFLLDVGLSYLTLDRTSNTLSGGEAQRIRLATQIGSGLTGVLYILDEPSIGLHQRDQERLIQTLKKLRDLGNTVIVVEHDEQTIRKSDYVIDVGPGAGKHGGAIVFKGTPKQLLRRNTLTGKYLAGKKKTDAKEEFKKIHEDAKGELVIRGAQEHNLKNIDVSIPLGRFVCITGVSGSGKSTLMNDILARSLKQFFTNSRAIPGKHDKIEGIRQLDKAIVVDQSPIGRTPRSNPATYTGVFTPVRKMFAKTREAQVRGYKVGRFSFNVKGGRCETCEGQGTRTIEMHFLPDIYVECEECHGTRYNKETLEICYNGKNIAEVLQMSVEEAHEFFTNIPKIKRRLKTLLDVGLGYMELGQPATTLSGGEAQRVKLATELAKKDTGHTLYILDEPTTGLHFDDIRKLLNVLHRLKCKGNTILVIEHNLDVIATADHIIDLGIEGGKDGGELVATGTVSDIIKEKRSFTGKWLRKTLNR